MGNRYTFADNDSASHRLALLARLFEPSSALLLESLCLAGIGRAVDLGCGPGHTTMLLHRMAGARETWGLDASARVVARARDVFGLPLAFAVHDVTLEPYPVARVDVFYARYLLTHIASPRAVLLACASAAAPGARLVLEDNCSLESSDALFSDYYTRVRALHSHYSQNMYVGEQLPTIAAETPWAIERFDRVRLELDGHAMAQLHAINVRNWRHDPFAASTFQAKDIDAMLRALEAVAARRRSAPDVTCVMAQLVLRMRSTGECAMDQRPSR